MGNSKARVRPGFWSRIRRRLPHSHLGVTAGVGIVASLFAGHTTGWPPRPNPLPLERAHAAPGAVPALDNLAATSLAASPHVVQAQLSSDAVGQTLPYLVYLPPGYDSDSAARYPVLYMLHGLGGSDSEWYSDGMFDTADRLIRSGEIQPLIIVLPEGEQAYWMDHANGGPKWGRYVAHDLVAEIDGRYRTLGDRPHRAIGGMSMGGHGALQLAMNNPDVFSVVGAHSFALRRHDTAPPYFGDQAYFDAHDPVALFKSQPATARSFTLWLDVGTDDSWRPADEAFHNQLTDEGITHAWHEYSGGHEDAYWSAHTADYLRFYATALRPSSSLTP
jgi:enterochelin esterase-like enzyme